MVPKETGNNAFAKVWRDKQRVLWYFWYWLIDRFTVVCSVTWPMNGFEAAGDLVLIQTSLLLSCKLCCCNSNRPFPSSCLAPLQSEAKCELFVMKISSHSYVK